MPSLARSAPKPLKVTSLARSVPQPLKVPSVARFVSMQRKRKRRKEKEKEKEKKENIKKSEKGISTTVECSSHLRGLRPETACIDGRFKYNILNLFFGDKTSI